MLFDTPPAQTSTAPVCPNCGAPVAAGAGFCTNCGSDLRDITGGPYPVRLDASYPEQLSRLSTFFRVFLMLPLVIMVFILGGSAGIFVSGFLIGGGILAGLILVYWIAVLVRGRPVGWLFDAMVAIQRFVLRANAYILLMADRYPPFEGDWQLNYEVDQPERIQRRQILIWKTVTSIPHFIALWFVGIFVFIAVFISWFVILLTGQFPKGFYNFVAGWLRWSARVNAYWMSLTDVFPAYNVTAEKARGGRTSYVLSAVIGAVLLLAGIGAMAAIIAAPGETVEVRVSYSDLQDGVESDFEQQAGIEVALSEVDDPYSAAEELLTPGPDKRFILFHVSLVNFNDQDVVIYEDDFRLKNENGDNRRPVLVAAAGDLSPVRFGGFDEDEPLFEGDVHVLFEIPEDAQPREFTYTPSSGFLGKERLKFILID